VSRVAVVLFDIDGTLIDSGGAGAESWRRAFDELYGIPADIGEFTNAGMTDPEVGRRTFVKVIGHEPSEEEMERLIDARQRHLPAAVAESKGYHVLPGVAELLPRLAERRLLLGLTTGGTREAAHVKLQRGGLNGFFRTGGYGSDSADRTELTRCGIDRAAGLLRRELARDEVLVIGDTPLDITAGHDAGATSVGVATGKYSVAELDAAGADHALATLEDPLPL
jgi:phosphoglycolate phosphatase